MDYDVKLINEANTPSNLYFIIKNENTSEQYNTLTDMFNNFNFSGSFGIKDEKIKKYEIYWKWPFENYNEDGTINEEKDLQDLNDAKSNLDYTFEFEISGKQSI